MVNLHLQNANNLPQISNAMHTHSVYNGMGQATTGGMGHASGLGSTFHNQAMGSPFDFRGSQQEDHFIEAIRQHQQEIKETKMADPKRRLIKVIIVDPDDKVPLDKCLLYSGSEKLTDLTDQELFFEIEIKDVLHDHNEVRKKIINKSVKERTEFLEPIKVRDLRMVVVTVAQF